MVRLGEDRGYFGLLDEHKMSVGPLRWRVEQNSRRQGKAMPRTSLKAGPSFPPKTHVETLLAYLIHDYSIEPERLSVICAADSEQSVRVTPGTGVDM